MIFSLGVIKFTPISSVRPLWLDKLNSNDFQAGSKSMLIYSKLSPKAIVTGHRENQFRCWGSKVFAGSNLAYQGCRGVEKLLGGT